MKDKYESTGTSLEAEIRAIVKDAIHESHEEGVHGASSDSSSSGRSILPLLFAVGTLVAAAYLMRSRSESMGETVDQMTERVQRVAEDTAERTDEVSEQAADRVQESGEMMAERTEEMSGQAAQSVDEGGTGVASRIEKGGKEAAGKMDEAASDEDDSTTSGGQ